MQENQKFQYLSKIPIFKKIIEMKQPSSGSLELMEERLNELLGLLFEDSMVYVSTGAFKNFEGFKFGIGEKGFFGFYKLAKKWLGNVQIEKRSSKNEVKLEYPYELAKQLFVKYVNFRKSAENGAKFKDGSRANSGTYEANIYDLFTNEDLIELGGNEFIRDCYTEIGQGNLSEKYKLNNKSCIQNIDSRTGKELKSNEDVKPNLYERVDNHLSWKIFKDGKVQDLNEYEVSILQEAIQNEGFWKHLGKTELKILPVTGGAALILGLIAAFAFGATGGALLALILTPIGAGALGIAPIVAPISQRSAIVDNMMEIDSKKNGEFNKKLQPEEERYKQYKDKNPDFLKLESKKEENIKEEENIINTDSNKENKVIPKNGEQNEQNEQNEQINPLKTVNETNQITNNQDNKNKNTQEHQENKEP